MMVEVEIMRAVNESRHMNGEIARNGGVELSEKTKKIELLQKILGAQIEDLIISKERTY